MKVCIETTDEGFLVYDEDAPESQEQAASVDEALEIARSMLGSAGVEDDAMSSQDPGPEEQAFQQGFEGA